jgi:cellulose synthase/poly-beta-1,6-N-acetylglucosamine synthase-like glycosyltransferase
MCFAGSTYRSIVWSGAVTEDIECHTDLVLRGLRVTFAPDARLEAEMPGSLDSAYTQNLRWESGRWQMVRRYALPLLKRAILTPSYVAFDALMEHLIPPTVLLVCLVLASILAGLLVGSWNVFWFGFLLLTVLAFYLIVGLSMVQAPRRVWLSLLYAPRYILWKLGVILRVGAGATPPSWIRTGR